MHCINPVLGAFYKKIIDNNLISHVLHVYVKIMKLYMIFLIISYLIQLASADISS